MAETITKSYTDKIAQSGSEFSFAWFDSQDTDDGFVSIGPNNTIGLIMDFSSLIETDSLGRHREPVAVHPTAITLYVKSISGSTDITSMRLFSVVQKSVTNFSTDNLPSDISPTLVEVAQKTDIDVSALSAGSEITWTFGYADDTFNQTFDTNWKKVLAALRRSDSDYRIALVLVDSSALSDANITFHNEDSSFPPSIEVTQFEFHTGHGHGQPGERAVHCQRTGRPVGAGSLSEDGYQEGVWVVSDQLDPVDSRRNPPEFPDTEGERLDEVPD